jgi:hypothetical protein
LSYTQFREQIRPYVQRSYLSSSFEHANTFGLTSLLGDRFVSTLFELPLNVWTGPIESSQGWHLIRIEERTLEGIADFTEARRKVIADWLNQEKMRWVNEQLSALRAQYHLSPEEWVNHE